MYLRKIEAKFKGKGGDYGNVYINVCMCKCIQEACGCSATAKIQCLCDAGCYFRCFFFDPTLQEFAELKKDLADVASQALSPGQLSLETLLAWILLEFGSHDAAMLVQFLQIFADFGIFFKVWGLFGCVL